MDNLINVSVLISVIYLAFVLSQQKELWLRYLKMAITFAVNYSFEIKSLMCYILKHSHQVAAHFSSACEVFCDHLHMEDLKVQ